MSIIPSKATLSQLCLLAASALVLSLLIFVPNLSAAQTDSQYFPQTGHSVSGKFLQYWRTNGGLPVYGYPITQAQYEIDPETGKTFWTQWFERNRFELHPENVGTKYEVLLGLLGKDLRREALAIDPDFKPNEALANSLISKEQYWYFAETGHSLRFRFLTYWLQNGGLERFGYPISETHWEVEGETGQPFWTQWFERARFEYHPENRPPYDILLGLLGKQVKQPRPGSIEFRWKIGGITPNLTSPVYAATNSQGNLYVADSGANRIFVYNSNLQPLFSFGGQGWAAGQFQSVGPLVVDRQGNIYVADKAALTIQKFDPTGHLLLKWGRPGVNDDEFGAYNNRISSITVDGQGNVFVLDNSNGRIKKFDSNGKFLLKWDPYDSINSYRYFSNGLVADKQGNIYVTESIGDNKPDTPAITIIKKFDNNGKFLLKWGGLGEADGQFSGRGDIGITSDWQDHIYLVDVGNRQIQKFDSSGQFLLKWSVEERREDIYLFAGFAASSQGNVFLLWQNPNRLRKFDSTGQLLQSWNINSSIEKSNFGPDKIVVDRQGNFYLLQLTDQTVQKFDNKGRLLFAFSNPDFAVDSAPDSGLSLATDHQGNLYVFSTKDYAIHKFDAAGNFLFKWGTYGKENGQFSNKISLTVDGQDTVYSVDLDGERVQKFDSSGNFLFKWQLSTQTDVMRPVDLAADSQGNLSIAVYGYILKYDSNGNLLKEWGTYGEEDGQFREISGIAIDGQDQVYVSDAQIGRVQKFDCNGQFLAKWGNPITPPPYVNKAEADGQFYYPSSLSVDAQGNIFVIDRGNSRVQKFAEGVY